MPQPTSSLRDAAWSLLRLPWDMSEQVATLMSLSGGPLGAGGMVQTLDTARREVENQCGALLKGAFDVSDRLSRGMTFEMMREAAAAVAPLLPDQTRGIVWQEFQNKLEAFSTFEYIDSILELPADTELPLPVLVEKAGSLDPYTRVWATEGVGHAYAERHWAKRHTPHNLLTEESLNALPSTSLITLHAGMGLSLAGHLLQSLPSQSTRADIRRFLRRFQTLCDENSRPGYTEITLEALGLVTRTLYPHLVSPIDRELTEMNLDLVALFWHGVGRGLYFLPVNFLPSPLAIGRAVAMAREEPPHLLGRLNTLAGLAWPLTLVNIRHPHILEACVYTHRAALTTNDAFSQGVSTAILTWQDSSPGDPAMQAFLAYRPPPSDVRRTKLWEDQIQTPSVTALSRYYELLSTQRRMGMLFRYQSLLQATDHA